MRAHEFLSEALNTIYPSEITSDSADDYNASFTTSADVNYVVHIEEVGDGEAEVQFYNTDVEQHKSQLITNTGDAFAVLATVIAVIQQYIKKYRPTQIEFTAEEPSRAKLYSALSKRLASIMPEYNFTERDLGSQIVFSFIKD